MAQNAEHERRKHPTRKNAGALLARFFELFSMPSEVLPDPPTEHTSRIVFIISRKAFGNYPILVREKIEARQRPTASVVDQLLQNRSFASS